MSRGETAVLKINFYGETDKECMSNMHDFNVSSNRKFGQYQSRKKLSV